MKSYSAPVLAALASGNVAVVQFLLLEFPSGDLAMNASTYAFDWDGVTYRAAYGMGSISPIKDGPGEIQGISLDLDGGDPTRIALALDGADEVQGTLVTIRTAIIDNSDMTSLTVLDAPIDWVGTCDTMAIGEDAESSIVSVSCESKAVDLLRGTPSTYSDADQQSLYPGDRAFEGTVAEVDKPVVWPSREYFFQ